MGITNTKDPNKISKMIKDLSQALNNYMSITTKEIDNIKRFVELNQSAVIEGNMKLQSSKRKIESKIQNIVNANKEITSKHEELESLVVEMTEMINKYKKPGYSKYRQRKDKDANSQNFAKYTKKEFLAAILHDKKRYDNGIMVVNDGTRIYKKKVWCKWIWRRGRWNTHYYVQTTGSW